MHPTDYEFAAMLPEKISSPLFFNAAEMSHLQGTDLLGRLVVAVTLLSLTFQEQKKQKIT